MRIHNYVRAAEKNIYYTSIGRHVLVCHFIYICTKFFHFPDKNEKIDESDIFLPCPFLYQKSKPFLVLLSATVTIVVAAMLNQIKLTFKCAKVETSTLVSNQKNDYTSTTGFAALLSNLSYSLSLSLTSSSSSLSSSATPTSLTSSSSSSSSSS
jgi:hypothetical protein